MVSDPVGFGSSARTCHYRFDPDKALTHLKRRDPVLKSLIRRVGPFAMESRAHLTMFQALLRAIVYQQLSGTAAASIERRLKQHFPSRRASPRRLLALDDQTLRDCGLSQAKIRAAKDLSDKVLDATVPTRQRLHAMSDEQVIERLCMVRGIGRWSAEMLLMFHMGRPDVLPVGDLGVRKGFMLHRRLAALPSEAQLTEHGQLWRPYRSVASWYLWRATELEWPG